MPARIGPINLHHQWIILKLLLLILPFLEFVHSGPRYSSRIVETKSGAIRGVILELNSRHLEPVEVFKSVPYAAPPVGNLRFEAPKKINPWKGTRLADSFLSVCPQNYPDITNKTSAVQLMPKARYNLLKKIVPLLYNQSEDCLTLNIYVPGSGNRGLEAPYSVFFYVHGDSFEWGSGNPYDGSVLASYGHVIVVTLNYRLGILGFIKTRASTAPGSGGNLGIMDIVAALQWVKDNIAAFGGDPTRITIVGHDTGAALANLVLISKSGKGLIHRAILLSGSALSPWSFVHDPDSIREAVSHQMACHLETKGNVGKTAKASVTDDITACLKEKPVEALLGVKLSPVSFMPSWGPFLPLEDSLDPEFAMEHSGEGFITSEIMLGITTTESYNDFSASDIQYGLEEEQRNRLLRTYIRNAFTFHLNEIFSAVRNEYTDWDKPIQHPINIRDSTMEAISDGHTVAPIIKVSYLHARRGAKTYLFHFGYQTKDSEYPQRLGSVRGEDIPYVFGLPLVLGMPNFPQNYTRQDMGVAEAILNFVTNFCKTGDPNEAGHQQAMLHPDYGTAKERTRYRGITWETYETTTQQYLSISLKPKMRTHYRGHKMALWLNLIPQLHRPGDSEVSMRHHHFREREQHYYAGAVRAESFTRPKAHYANGLINDAQESRQDTYGSECTPDPTIGEALQETDGNSAAAADAEDEEMLQKLADRHYYSYTAALGVTVGVGCLLLILNMLIFAGIYYQRDRSRRKARNPNCSNVTTVTGVVSGGGGGSSPECGDIPLTTRPGNSPGKKRNEPPPSYATLPKRTPCKHNSNDTNTLKRNGSGGSSASIGGGGGSSSGGDKFKEKIFQQHHHQQQQQQPETSSQQIVVINTMANQQSQSQQQQSLHHHHHHHHHPQQHQPHQPHQEQHPTTGCGKLSSLKPNCLKPLPPVRSSSNPQPILVNSHHHQQHQSQSMMAAHHQPLLAHPTTSLGGESGGGGGIAPGTSTGTINHNNNINNNSNANNNNVNNLSGVGSSNANHSNTSTLKKRVQIQEVTV